MYKTGRAYIETRIPDAFERATMFASKSPCHRRRRLCAKLFPSPPLSESSADDRQVYKTKPKEKRASAGARKFDPTVGTAAPKERERRTKERRTTVNVGRRIIPARMAGCWLGDDSSLDAVHLASDERRKKKKKWDTVLLVRLWIVRSAS